jgi:hypothetical protein
MFSSIIYYQIGTFYRESLYQQADYMQQLSLFFRISNLMGTIIYAMYERQVKTLNQFNQINLFVLEVSDML